MGDISAPEGVLRCSCGKDVGQWSWTVVTCSCGFSLKPGFSLWTQSVEPKNVDGSNPLEDVGGDV